MNSNHARFLKVIFAQLYNRRILDLKRERILFVQLKPKYPGIFQAQSYKNSGARGGPKRGGGLP